LRYFSRSASAQRRPEAQSGRQFPADPSAATATVNYFMRPDRSTRI